MSDWFIAEPDGNRLGPLSLDDIKARIAAGTLAPETPVWKQRMPEWQAAKDTELGAEFLNVPPPVPLAMRPAFMPSPDPLDKNSAGTGADALRFSELESSGYAAPPRGLIDAVALCLSKYATFSGRASRSEYWYWTLFSTLLQLAIGFLEGFFAGRETAFGWIVTLALFLPGIAVQARRLHDIDRSGWWQLLLIVPIVGWIILIVWNCKRGVDYSTRFS
ncbi:Inner membrane protein YhaH [Paracoccus haematequi]|uniref:Inner membrane protein YhaH n=1 Tax=Paracoccus haematequi TaxID=2491866 RepID=A0A3S4DW20_9RHOB|nr:DUF805 domain-containing protein [Paracoccus haematequi]VDS08648.1 Inner membrane protein YhaH [Paracoccus haematequi]